MTYYAGMDNTNAVHEWQLLAERLEKGGLEWYKYWQALSTRESFDNGEKQLTDE